VITALIFDIGDVVWRYRVLLDRLFEKWSLLSDLPLPEFKNQYTAYYKLFETNQKTLDDFVVFLNQNDPAPYYQALADIYRCEEFVQYLNQPLLAFINDLRSIIKVGYLSNAENFFYPHIHQQLKSNFDFGYCSWELGLEKPNPEIFKKVLALENLEPSQVLFIDDVEKNTASARSVGIETILFVNDSHLITELRKIQI